MNYFFRIKSQGKMTCKYIFYLRYYNDDEFNQNRENDKEELEKMKAKINCDNNYIFIIEKNENNKITEKLKEKIIDGYTNIITKKLGNISKDKSYIKFILENVKHIYTTNNNKFYDLENIIDREILENKILSIYEKQKLLEIKDDMKCNLIIVKNKILENFEYKVMKIILNNGKYTCKSEINKIKRKYENYIVENYLNNKYRIYNRYKIRYLNNQDVFDKLIKNINTKIVQIIKQNSSLYDENIIEEIYYELRYINISFKLEYYFSYIGY